MELNKQQLIEKYQGSMLGLAIGDVLGVPIEFKYPGSFEPVSDFIDSDRFGLGYGCWSDDTAMSLCLANSLIENNGFNPVDQVEKYKQWLNTGYCSSTGKAIGVGQTILRALACHRNENGPYTILQLSEADGNGSLMRLAPVPLYYRGDPGQAIEKAKLSSKITHNSDISGDACRYYTGLIIGALNGVSKEELLADLYCPIPDYWQNNQLVSEIHDVAIGSFRRNHPPIIQGSGYVVKSLEAALWAFYNSESFEEGVLKAVNLGDDADTTGAIFGQLAGAYYGINGIPEKWVNNVAKSDEIIEMANKIFYLANKKHLKMIKVIQGDITESRVDAIVNAANQTLLGGGGVDGTIHYCAGPQLLEECRTLGGCNKGEAKITKGYNLPAKHIIHTVGPIYGHEDGLEDEILANCYKNSMELAKKHRLRSIVFPAISTGAFRFPKDQAAKIAINAVNEFLGQNPDTFDEVVFVLYDQHNYFIYSSIVEEKNEK